MANGNTQLLQQCQQSRSELDRRLARIDSRLATLEITEDKTTGDFTLFAGQNLEHIIGPLLLMKSSLPPFLMELVRSRKIDVEPSDVECIYKQVKELLALCHEASAAELRGETKTDCPSSSLTESEYIHLPQYNSEARSRLMLQTKNQHHTGEPTEQLKAREISKTRRSRYWNKRLKQGTLEVQLSSTLGAGHEQNSRSLHASFTFWPSGALDFKALNVSFASEVNAYTKPKILHNIRCFNWLCDGLDDDLKQTFIDDNVDTLRQRLMDRKLTPWDSVSFGAYDDLPILLVCSKCAQNVQPP